MSEMSGTKKIIRANDVQYLWLILILVLASLRCVWCAEGDNITSKASNDPLLEDFAKSLFNSQLSNLTKLLDKELSKTLGFCIIDADSEINSAFNYSSNMDFGANCVKETQDAMLRLCTAAEMKFYFASFINHNSTEAQFMKPNRNCNLTSWLPGCEPGWACRSSDNKKVDFRNANDIPDRTRASKPCCEGFYCPRGLTCMIPCPLGSYCPRAKFNETTGICDPYNYQLPPGKPNHTCGGADIWASSVSSNEMFCSAGSFCPSTIRKIPCTKGHYCQMGSSDQKECSMLSTCNPNTAKQNLHAYAVLLIGVLSFILVVFYNCSDQVLTTRYERQAKSREKAAKIARETAQARARWKLAKNAARSNATGLKQQISHTFSSKRSGWGPEQQKDLDQPKTSTSDASLAPNPSKSNIPLPPSAAPNAKRKESNLTKMMQSIENDPESHEGFHFQIGDKNIKKQKPKNAKLHTRSQIFKYAYGQLEEEKAMEQKRQKLTFSGVIQMATDTETRKRPTIEVAFKNLTITLKGKNKHLMRSVTGKILPGRISAVMGPSGAGKTTFLSAVMGKITGCTVTGSILVNGRAEPIQSYKKIIGFVPQDDIVHGNLTVEENLRFSARCRLPADMPKADRVLVVERVIESLGLQAIRESLVGTVEKRGISGGQRKRVNVGLEMVMEPSLLILDEPTSGLDSASSNLLLKALRREALEGVNICMVVHQPSYTLYKMFHDLILLAKGGLIVYQGPVDKVEEYFTGMGITVPDRVNPPDHLIDILEGMIKPSGGMTAQQLPVRWMLYNGYPVPPDMLEHINEVGTFSKPPEQNFSGDSWQEKQDHVQHKSLISHDLSSRTTVGLLRQYRYFLGRVSKQRLREAKTQAVDYLILLLAGACLGILSDNKDDVFGYFGYMYSVIAVSLLCKISALRSFSLDKLHFKRESDSGMSILASFLSKDTLDHFNTVIKPVVFLSMFYFLNSPRSTFASNYLVLLCLVYCVTGIAYIFAICLEPGPAQLWCVLLPVVMTLIATQEEKENITKYLADLCYPKWAMEAFVTANAKEYTGVWLITRCGALMKLGYSVHNETHSLILLVLTGVVSRLLAYLCLVAFAKK